MIPFVQLAREPRQLVLATQSPVVAKEDKEMPAALDWECRRSGQIGRDRERDLRSLFADPERLRFLGAGHGRSDNHIAATEDQYCRSAGCECDAAKDDDVFPDERTVYELIEWVPITKQCEVFDPLAAAGKVRHDEE